VLKRWNECLADSRRFELFLSGYLLFRPLVWFIRPAVALPDPSRSGKNQTKFGSNITAMSLHQNMCEQLHPDYDFTLSRHHIETH